jgi:hypothetical protein
MSFMPNRTLKAQLRARACFQMRLVGYAHARHPLRLQRFYHRQMHSLQHNAHGEMPSP